MKKILLCLCLLLCSCSTNNSVSKKLYDVIWEINYDYGSLIVKEWRYKTDGENHWEYEILSTNEYYNYDIISVDYYLEDKYNNIVYIYTSGHTRLIYKK